MEDQDPDWLALVAAIRARDLLTAAVSVLRTRHSLDESAAIRRLLWVSIAGEVALVDAAHRVLEGDDEPQR